MAAWVARFVKRSSQLLLNPDKLLAKATTNRTAEQDTERQGAESRQHSSLRSSGAGAVAGTATI